MQVRASGRPSSLSNFRVDSAQEVTDLYALYLAVDPETSTQYLIKEFTQKAISDQATQASISQEISAFSKLRHPTIAKFYL